METVTLEMMTSASALASRDRAPAFLRVRAHGLRLLEDRLGPEVRSRRARAGALLSLVQGTSAGCGDSCLRPAQFRARNCVHPGEACGHFSRAEIRHRLCGFHVAIASTAFHR